MPSIRGVPAVLVDRLNGPPDAGLGLNLPGKAVRALRDLGVGEELKAGGAGSTAGIPQRRQSIAVRYRRGRFLGCGCWLDLRAARRCVGASARGRVDVRGALGTAVTL
jgi:hypothetical protein